MGLIIDTICGLFYRHHPVLYRRHMNRDQASVMCKRASDQIELLPGEFATGKCIEEDGFRDLLRRMPKQDRSKLLRDMEGVIGRGGQIVPIKVEVRKKFGLISRHMRDSLAIEEVWPAGRRSESEHVLDLNEFNLLRLAVSGRKR